MNGTIELTQEARELVSQAETIVTEYSGYRITDIPGYMSAGEILKRIKSKYAAIEDVRKSMTRPLDDSKKKIMDFFKKPLDFLSQAENIIKKSMIAFQAEQEEKRKAEEARLAELRQKEAEKLLKKADRAEGRGDAIIAENLRHQAQETAAITPVVVSDIEAVQGISTKKVWKYRIVDINKIPREYMIPNEKAIGEVARATKGTLQIPGVEMYSEDTIAASKK